MVEHCCDDNCEEAAGGLKMVRGMENRHRGLGSRAVDIIGKDGQLIQPIEEGYAPPPAQKSRARSLIFTREDKDGMALKMIRAMIRERKKGRRLRMIRVVRNIRPMRAGKCIPVPLTRYKLSPRYVSNIPPSPLPYSSATHSATLFFVFHHPNSSPTPHRPPTTAPQAPKPPSPKPTSSNNPPPSPTGINIEVLSASTEISFSETTTDEKSRTWTVPAGQTGKVGFTPNLRCTRGKFTCEGGVWFVKGEACTGYMEADEIAGTFGYCD
ncbi:MAG: hypothetical protein Q9169_004971 [Polycauliona sp. 2 TL-2023]